MAAETITRLPNERAQYLLKVLIQRFIRDGQPVGSHTLAKESRLDLSPATIRNIMVELEELGFVSTPHTSAGRVPTPKGYRLFVDTLVRYKPPRGAELEKLKAQLESQYDDPDATANAQLSARLPYLFASCRFAHYLKCIVRDKIGTFGSRAEMERWLNDWILQYVDGDPDNSSQEVKARKPLAAAEVVVQDVEGNPGYYTARFSLRPHYQLEGMSIDMSLVSKLPSEKGA